MKPRLSFLQLEDRLTPALNVFLSGGNLLITGTPLATSPGTWVGFNEAVSVSRTQGDNYLVTDGDTVLGTYAVTGNLTLDFESIDNDVVVDLNGGTLRGNLSIDLGQGDIDQGTTNYITVVDGTVAGGVSFSGAKTSESIGACLRAVTQAARSIGIGTCSHSARGRWSAGT
jgi:hypothetical protein